MSAWTGVHLSGAPKPAPRRWTLLRHAGRLLAQAGGVGLQLAGYVVAVGLPFAALYFAGDRFGLWR